MNRDEQITAIAEAFAEVMRQWLSPAEFAEMKRLNETAEYASGCCASANFCDSNMAMDAAFQQVLGREPNVVGEGPEIEAECAIWNEAWDLARNLYMGSYKIKEEI